MATVRNWVIMLRTIGSVGTTCKVYRDIVLLLILLLLVITLIQNFNNYLSETNHVSTIYNVAVIL